MEGRSLLDGAAAPIPAPVGVAVHTLVNSNMG
jgi:hypothetical protein